MRRTPSGHCEEVKRSLYAEGEEGAATLETPAGPLRVVGNCRHLGCPPFPERGASGHTSRRPCNANKGQDECGEMGSS